MTAWLKAWIEARVGAATRVGTDVRDRVTTDWRVSTAVGVSVLLVLGTAAFYPATAGGGAAMLVLAASVGVGLAWLTRSREERAENEPPQRQWWSAAVVVGVIVLVGVNLFEESWDATGWQIKDWGPHHANLRHLIDGLRDHGEVPNWVLGLSSGEPVFELYPVFPYWLAAKAASITGSDNLPLVLTRLSVIVHITYSVGVALLTRRLASWPLGIVIGIVALYDAGTGTSGGASGLLKWGILHGAIANMFWVFVVLAVLDAIERPRLGASVRIWVLTALAIASHPSAMLMAMATCIALLLVAATVQHTPRRRPLFAAVHIAIGVALAAGIWASLGARLMANGISYGLPPNVTWSMFKTMISHPLPISNFAIIVFIGYLGVLAGALSRRPAPSVCAFMVALMVFGGADQIYLLLDLSPSVEVGRMAPLRLVGTAKAPLFACAGFAVWLAIRQAAGRWTGAHRLVLGGLVGVFVLIGARFATPYFDIHGAWLDTESQRYPIDQPGLEEVMDWARKQRSEMTPGTYARLLHEVNDNYGYHINAETDLPTVRVAAVATYFLRERMNDFSGGSLRRFNIRWALKQGGPPVRGDRKTLRRFGSYYVQEVPGWDGKLARIERGRGEVRVTRADNRGVDVELTGTDQPALVALGTGYYPRWRARHETKGSLPVYAFPARRGSGVSVPAAWLPPGRTSFRPNGALPSDGKGRVLSWLALLIACAIIGAWSFRRPRLWALRRMAIARRYVIGKLGWALVIAIGVGSLIIIGGAIAQSQSPTRALQLGNGLTSSAVVEARRDRTEPWQRCEYSALRGGHHCHGLLLAVDTMGKSFADEAPGWAYAAPLISLWSVDGDAQFRIRVQARLRGKYTALAHGGRPDLTIDDGKKLRLGRPADLRMGRSKRVRSVELTGTAVRGRPLQIGVVRDKHLEVERRHPRAPKAPPP